MDNQFDDESGVKHAPDSEAGPRLRRYLFKLVRYRHMDADLGVFLMLKSLTNVKSLYHYTRKSKAIKNHWHRDDPVLTACCILLLTLVALIEAIFYPQYGYTFWSQLISTWLQFVVL